jgi:hypothetical protein
MYFHKHYWFPLIILSIIFGTIYSLHWIIPFLNHEFYVPIYKYIISTGYDDNYIWYSHIKDILNGTIILRDPTNIEFQNTYSIFTTYNFSVLFASVGGFFTEKISNIYNFNYFIFPILNFIAISLVIRNFIKENHINFLITTLVVYFTQPTNIFYFTKEILVNLDNLWEIFANSDFSSIHANRSNQLHRLPNIMITNIFLMLNIYFFLNYEINFKKFFFNLFFVLSIGSSIYFSVNNFIITYIFMFFLIIYKLNDKKIFLYLLSISFLSLLFSLPGAIILVKNFFNLDYFNFINVADKGTTVNIYDQPKNIISGSFIFLYKYIIYLFIIFIAIFKDNLLNDKKYFLSAPIPTYLFLSILFLFLVGKYYEWRILNRGIIFLISISFYICLVKLTFYYINLPKKFICWFLIILLNTIFFSNQFTYAKNNSHKYNQKNFYLLTEWINNNTDDKDYFITIDPQLMPNLSIYTNANLYISIRELSLRSLDERLNRLSEVFFKFKLNEKDLYDYILNEESDIFSKKMQINIFYEENLTPKKKEYYKNVLNENFKKLSNKSDKFKFKADYLIINHKYKFKVFKNFITENDLINYQRVYKNDEYTLFKVTN